MELAGKLAVVIGLGRSGHSAVRFLAAQGARIIATDMKRASELAVGLDAVTAAAAELALGDHPDDIFERADLVVVSPGVPKDLPPLVKAGQRGVPVLSELELAARHVSAPVIAVTGTNGKSTVAALLGEIMKDALGKDLVFVGGNIGTPFIELPISKRPVKAAVVEVSSFQLEFADTFHPKVAAMLNLTPDHLDRYRDFEEYAGIKWRIFANQDASDFAVINADDPLVAKLAAGLKARVMSISASRAPGRGMCLQGRALEYRGPEGAREELALGEVPLRGRHNLMNVMAAYCAARAMGVGPELIRSAIRRFRGLAHRLELVRELSGVRFYDDSKATNPGAVEAAVNGLDQPLVLLMGGRAKGCTFAGLARAVKHRVKQVVAFGECRGEISKEMAGTIPVTTTATLAEALAQALESAGPGDAVLLAPGCASFDQFKSYQDRGETFKRLVMEIE